MIKASVCFLDVVNLFSPFGLELSFSALRAKVNCICYNSLGS